MSIIESAIKLSEVVQSIAREKGISEEESLDKKLLRYIEKNMKI